MTSISFINAIRHQQPVAYIEKCRNNIPKRHWWDVPDYVYTNSDALQLAVMYGNIEYVAYFLDDELIRDSLAPACCPIILMAISIGADDILELICQRVQKAQILCKGVPYIDARGCIMEEGKTPLHLAIQLGRVHACNILLKYGANPNVTDMYGLTALERGLQTLLISNDELENLLQTATRPDFTEKHPVFLQLKKKRQSILLNLLELGDFMITTDRESVPFLRGLLRDCFNILPQEFLGALLYLNHLMEKLFEPPSLVRLCRFSIRSQLRYRHLPHAVEHLGLPPYLAKYVLHDIKEALVTL
ncbi:uncharacterized protein LOC135485238 [Lineus longissimus]|uniref:uncharacterized protein LOC135485238 n=1 Tax=Lineus longissimus TaxID=88925 RepID=UPI002B4D42EE